MKMPKIMVDNKGWIATTSTGWELLSVGGFTKLLITVLRADNDNKLANVR